jgi:UDP-N-acetylglucosamine 2-epimerase
MRVADAMLGNSSSALLEAPALGLPAVNVGDRQAGRLKGANVLDAAANIDSVTSALRRALTTDMKAKARASGSPYGDGRSSSRIVEILGGWTPPKPPVKKPISLTR